MVKRKNKPRISKGGKLVPVENYAEQRAKFPSELIDAFLAVSESNWDNEEFYEEYIIEARRYLGDKFEDKIEQQGKLVVLLSKATGDLRNVKEIKKEEKKD